MNGKIEDIENYKTELKFFVSEEHKNCEKCVDLVKSRKQITSGFGNTKSKILFLGEAPGRFGCDITGIPFTKDRSGVLFQEYLKKNGFSLNEIYITNIVKCCPPQNRTSNEIEIKNCKNYFEKELEIIKPQIIVTIGKVATNYILNENYSITKIAGKLFRYQNYVVIPILHPAYIIRNLTNETLRIWQEQWNAVKKEFLLSKIQQRGLNEFK